MQFVDFPIGKWGKNHGRAQRVKILGHIFSIKCGRICSKIHAVFSYEHISNQSTHPGAVFRAPHVAMCTRVPSPPPSHPPQSLPPPFPLQSSAPPPFPPPPTLLPPVSPLPSPRAMLCIHPRPGSRRPPLLARLARLGSRLGLALSSARLGLIVGTARTARHGSARLGTAGTAAAARMPEMPAWSALLGAAQLSSAQLGASAQPGGSSGSARSARLGRLRLTRFSARGGAPLVAATCVHSTGQVRR